MLDKTLETKALGYLFDNPDVITKYRSEYFTSERLTYFRAMQEAYAKYGIVTIEGVAAYTHIEIPEVTSVYVADISPVLDKLKELSQRRSIAKAADELREASTAKNFNPAAIDLTIDALQTFDKENSNIEYGVVELLSELSQKQTGSYTYTSTGFPFLDVMLGGEWPKSELSTIVAAPGTGKTALVCNSMLSMGIRQQPSLFFSLEMSKKLIVSRWVSDMCTIDNLVIRSGKLKNDEIEQIEDAVNTIRTLPIYVIDTPYMSVYDMLPIIRQHVKERGVKVVFIDYLQLINVGDDMNKGLGNAANQLKNIAKRENIHVCLLAQRTMKGDRWVIRDSGDVEQVVDTIIYLDSDKDEADVKSVMTEFTKNRNGKLGKAPMLFDGRYMRFKSV